MARHDTPTAPHIALHIYLTIIYTYILMYMLCTLHAPCPARPAIRFKEFSQT